MPIFTAQLSDGRRVRFEADEEPDEQDLLAAVEAWQAPEEPSVAESTIAPAVTDKPSGFFGELAKAPGEIFRAAGIVGRDLLGERPTSSLPVAPPQEPIPGLSLRDRAAEMGTPTIPPGLPGPGAEQRADELLKAVSGAPFTPPTAYLPEEYQKPLEEAAGTYGKYLLGPVARLALPEKAQEGVARGLYHLAEGLATPIGVATLGMGALPSAAQRGVSLAFAAQMIKDSPQIATALGEEFGKPKDERDPAKIAQLVTEAAGTAGFATLAAKHGLTPAKGASSPIELNRGAVTTEPLPQPTTPYAPPERPIQESRVSEHPGTDAQRATAEAVSGNRPEPSGPVPAQAQEPAQAGGGVLLKPDEEAQSAQMREIMARMAKIKRVPVTVEGPDGKTYPATFDGMEDFSLIGKGKVRQITLQEAIPGVSPKGGTTYDYALAEKGFKVKGLPEEAAKESSAPAQTPGTVRLYRGSDAVSDAGVDWTTDPAYAASQGKHVQFVDLSAAEAKAAQARREATGNGTPGNVILTTAQAKLGKPAGWVKPTEAVPIEEPTAPAAKVERPKTAPVLVSALESAAEKARARLEQRRKSTAYGSGPLHELPNIADWTIIGASKLARGGYDVAKWSLEMARELGDQIKPYLEQVYRHSLAMSKRMAATLEKEREGIGAVLSQGVDLRREEQATHGAALMQAIIRENGKFDPKAWADGMLKEFGADIRDETELEGLFKSARDEMTEGTPIPVKPSRTPFPSPRGPMITMSEKAALKNSLRERQSASQVGQQAGATAKAAELAPVIAGLREKLSNSVSKLQALGQYFTGQERGSATGAKAARADAEHIDRWLSADVENIRDSLLKLAQGLPVQERGRFLSAITGALKRPGLFATDVTIGGKINPQKISVVDAMYRRAAKVASRMEARMDEINRKSRVDAIREFGQWKESEKIDVPYRQKIMAELKTFDRLEKAGGLSDDALQAFHDRLTSLRDSGRTEQNVKEALWQWQKDFAEARLQGQPTRPVETRPELRPQPGESTPISMRMRNWLNNARNKAAIVDKALMPIDALFDLMESAKGTYDGWLFRHARGPVDLGYNQAMLRRDQTLSAFEKLVKENKLTSQNAERIGVFAQNMQEGGRQRLIDAGLTPEAIDRIVKSLTPTERRAYGMMREIMDAQLPEIQDTMRRLYNTEVKPERNYFPMPRDWRVFEETPGEAKAPGTEVAFDELATWKPLLEDLTPRATHNTRKGFTLERQQGAKTPIRIDAFDIFRQHINDTAYLIEMQPVLKQMGELARGDLFRTKYGDVGQKIMLDWLDTVARQGGVESFKRWKLLDTLRKNTSVGIIGFRLASQVVHESNVPYIAARIGPWFGTGMREAFTERGQKFLTENFSETKQRGGGEPSQAESEREGVKLAGVQVVSPGVARASYSIARNLDRFNSQASVLGTYLKILKDKGSDWQRYDELPIDREAQRMALILARRSIASPLAKDVPQALSRGRLTGGNVSLGRSLFQFQNIFLDQWSNIRHDLWQAGIREKNPKLAATMFLAITGAIALETAIKESSKGLISYLTGYQPKKKDENEFAHKAITETVRRFPFGGQVENELMYGDTGVPIIDATLIDIPKAIKSGNAARTAGAIGQVMGVPGASQVTELIDKATR